MNIGFDIDGVLTNEEDYLTECLTKYVYENNLPDITNPLGFETRKYDDMEKMFSIYLDNFVWEYAENWKPRLFASEIIHKLRQDGHKIFIITSRRPAVTGTKSDEKMQSVIKNWLSKNKIEYDGLFFEKDKTIKMKELKLDAMVEDNPETIPTFVKITHTFCFDNRYNTHLNLENMTRVYSFYDLYRKINNYFAKIQSNN